MLTNNMVSLVAKNGSWATKLAKQAAENKSVRTAIGKQLDVVGATLAASVTVAGKAALGRPFANRKNRRLAVQVARQIVGGTYARAVIAGDRYWVVWQDETPFEVYPPLPECIGTLAERRELQNYQARRLTPHSE